MNKIVGLILGIGVAMLVITGVEWVDTMLYPMPVMDVDDPVAFGAMIAAMPLPAKLLVVAGFLIGALTGAAVALRLSQWRPAGWIVAGVVAAAGLVTVVAIPHPVWMRIAAVVAPLLGGWLAERWFHRAQPGDPLIG